MARNKRDTQPIARAFPQVGTLFDNRYQLLGLLGSGGGSAVFKALDTRLDREVALKLLSPTGMDPAGIARLKREAVSIARLSHPSIVTIHDFDEADGIPYLVLELVAGDDLWAVMYEQDAELSIKDSITICRNILGALQYAHERGVIHRDLKPENVMITNEQWDTKVTDFGLAYIRGQSRITREGVVSGSAYYIAPEVATNKPSDHRVDLYALGIMLYELCAYRLPFYAENPIAVIAQHVHDTPMPPSHYNPEISPTLEAIILKLLSKNPNDRFTSAEAVIDALDSLDQAPQFVGVTSQQTLIDRITRTRPVGRDAEWNQLREAWQKVQLRTMDTQPIAMILGEAGSGKTQFVNQIMLEARHSGAQVLVAQSNQSATTLPYQVIISLLRDYLTHQKVDLTPMMATDLSRLVPEIAGRYATVELPSLSAEADRLRLYAHVTQLLLNAAEDTPLLIVLEDLHTTDPSSLSMLEYLCKQLRGSGVFILGTYRPSELDHQHPLGYMMRDLLAQDLVVRIVLRRLTLDDVHTLTQYIFGEQISRQLAQVVFDKTQGNFFFTKELLKSLVVDGHVYWDAETLQWQVRHLDGFELPSSIRSILGQQLSQVSEDTQNILSAAAVIGRDFRFRTLKAVTDVGEDALIDALEEAIKARLIIEKREVREETYTFANLAIHQTLIESLNHRRKSRLHLQVARALEQVYPNQINDNLEVIARHYSLGARTDEDIAVAIDYLRKAADRAAQLFALSNALDLYNTALELAQDDVSPKREERIARLFVRRGMIYHQMGNFTASATDFETAIQSPHLAPERKRSVMLQLGQVYRRAEQFDRATSTLSDAVDLSRQIGDERLLADALFFLGATHWSLSQITVAMQFQAEAYEIVQRLGLRDEVAMRVLHGLAECSGRSVDYTRLFKLAEQSMQLAESLGDLEYQSENLMIMGTAELDRAEYEHAQSLFEDNLEVCLKAGLRWHRIANLAVFGMAIAATGDYQRGLTLLEEAVDSAQGLPRGFLLSLVYHNLGRCYLELEALDHADKILSKGMELAQRYGVSWSEAGTKAYWGQVQIRKGNLEVGAMLQNAIDTYTALGDMRHVPLLYGAMSELELARGNAQQALDWANQMHALATRYDQTAFRLQAQCWQGRALVAWGQLPKAQEILKNAIESAVSIHSPRLNWELHQALADAYDAVGNHQQAVHCRQRVYEIVDGLANNLQDEALQTGLRDGLPRLAHASVGTLRLLVISDAFSTMVRDALTAHRDEVLQCDAIILLGDLPSKTYPALRKEFNLPMRGFCVFGNHDNTEWASWLPRYKFEYLHNRPGTIRIGGQEISLMGFSGSEVYNEPSGLQWDDYDAERQLRTMPPCDIFLSHTIGTPPPGYQVDHIHRGLPAIQNYVDQHQPQLVLHGHFHENYQTQSGATTVIGCYGAVLVECMMIEDTWQINATPINKPLWD